MVKYYPSLTEDFIRILSWTGFLCGKYSVNRSGQRIGGKNGNIKPGASEKKQHRRNRYGLIPLTRELYADAVTPVEVNADSEECQPPLLYAGKCGG